MIRMKFLIALSLVLLGAIWPGMGELSAAEATFTVILTDYQSERDKKLVEAFDLTVSSTKNPANSLVRPFETNQIHDADKATLTIETKYKRLPEGEYEVWYWIPSMAFTHKPYMERFQLLPDDHFRKKLVFSTRKVMLRFQVSSKVREHIREDEFPAVTIAKVKDGSEEASKTMDYSFSGFRRGADKTELGLWLIPDGEYVVTFTPVWGRPMKVPFRIVEGKTIPEVITFSDENRVRRDD